MEAVDATYHSRPAASAADGTAMLVRGLNVAGIAFLAIGVTYLAGTPIESSMPDAISGVQSQLGTTLPALALVLVATAANLALGAYAGRAIIGQPFRDTSSLLLTGLGVAVLIDTFLLLVAGTFGLYSWWLIAGVHVVGLAIGAFTLRPLMAAIPRPPSPGTLLAHLLPALVFGAPVLLQLASPVVPFMDVLFNHVSPVEHARQFGMFAELTTNPSPNFGPSRALLGYVGLHATLSTLVDLPAVLSTAAFILPLTVLFAVATRRLATVLFGTAAGYWSLFTVPLTFVFLRLPDSRATVLVFPLIAWALVLLLEGWPTGQRRRVALLATVLGAAIFVHPFIAGLGLMLVVVLSAIHPERYAGVGLPAAAGAVVLAAPQAAATLAIELPSATAIVAVPAAIAAVLVVERLPRAALVGVRAGMLFAAGFVLLNADEVVGHAADALRDLASPFPLLTLGTVGVLAVATRRTGSLVVVLGIGCALAVVAAAHLLPADTPLVQSLQGESAPKALWYWGPYMLAMGAAGVMGWLWVGPRANDLTRGAVLVAVLLAVVPLRLGPITANLDNYEEHRMSESVSIALRHAGRGYWTNYPDPRVLVSPPQVEVLQELVDARRRGEITSETRLLHVAESFRPWVGTPVAVYTGITETTVAADAEQSIHTEGGRLFFPEELPRLLEEPFEVLFLEGDDVVDDWADDAAAAGFEAILTNERGQLYRR